MAELNRAQLLAWESSLQMAAAALEDPRGGTARFQARLRGTMSALRETVESLKRMAAARELANRQATEARIRLEGVVEQMPIPYLLTTSDGTVLAANTAAGAALNLSPRVLVGRNLLIFFDEREAWLEALATTAASGQSMRRAGNVRPRERVQEQILATLSAVVTAEGPAIHWFLTGGPRTATDTGTARASARRYAHSG